MLGGKVCHLDCCEEMSAKNLTVLFEVVLQHAKLRWLVKFNYYRGVICISLVDKLQNYRRNFVEKVPLKVSFLDHPFPESEAFGAFVFRPKHLKICSVPLGGNLEEIVTPKRRELIIL